MTRLERGSRGLNGNILAIHQVLSMQNKKKGESDLSVTSFVLSKTTDTDFYMKRLQQQSLTRKKRSVNAIITFRVLLQLQAPVAYVCSDDNIATISNVNDLMYVKEKP